MSLENRPRFGYPVQSDIERVKVLIEDNPQFTIRELSAILGCNHSTINHHLYRLGKVNELGTWVPYQLTSDNIRQTITICNFLLSNHHRHRFLQQFVTDDKMWFQYVWHRRKRQWVNPEYLSELEAKEQSASTKVMPSVC